MLYYNKSHYNKRYYECLKYFLNFTTLYLVDDLKGITDQVSQETYKIINSKITDIFQVQEDYEHMLIDVGRKGCYPYQETQAPEALWACNLQTLLSQVNVLSSSTTSHMDHSVSTYVLTAYCVSMCTKVLYLFLFLSYIITYQRNIHEIHNSNSNWTFIALNLLVQKDSKVRQNHKRG